MTIREQGGKAHLVMVDLCSLENQDLLVNEACKSGPVDIWINNAGVDVLTGPLAAESFETRLHRLWQVDVQATMRMSRDVGQRMVSRGHGVLLNMGWDQAQTGMAGESGQMFAAIKGAVMAFSLSLARSLAPKVRVNCLAPGWIRTAWGETAPLAWQQQAINESLVGRWGTPVDVARAARFLVSEEAAFINGQILPLNGGFSGTTKQPQANCRHPEEGPEGNPQP